MFYISFFKEFKYWNRLTINEKIVYSFLVNYATMHQIDSWDNASEIMYGEKRLDMGTIKDMIEEYSYLCFQKITNKKISDKTGISLSTVSKTLIKFKTLEILDEGKDRYNEYYRITIPNRFIDKGFLVLPKNTELKGMQLIFWEFINERLKHYNANTGRLDNLGIDSWASQIARDMGVKKKDIQNYIHILTKKKYLSRSKNGKLLYLNIKPNYINTTLETYASDSDLPF